MTDHRPKMAAALPLAVALLASLLAVVSPRPAAAADAPCGGPVPCPVPTGAYRIVLPAAPPVGAYVFFHGYRGSAAAMVQSADLVAAATDRGLAFVAPDGVDGRWSHSGSPDGGRNERAFVRSVLADIVQRFAVPADAILVGGFSQGASMAWYTLCQDGDRLAGAVTFAGVFWEPAPTAADCGPSPPLIHVHGRNDPVFPLAGRPIGTHARQSDTFISLDTLRAASGCLATPRVPLSIAGLPCQTTPACRRGPLVLCLHDGGHEMTAAWLAAALDQLGRTGRGGR